MEPNTNSNGDNERECLVGEGEGPREPGPANSGGLRLGGGESRHGVISLAAMLWPLPSPL